MSWAVSVFSWTSIAKAKVSQHTCVSDSMWTFQPVRFRARLSWPPPPLPTPFSLSLIPIPDEAVWLTTNFSCIDTQQTMTRFTMLRGSSAALFNVGATAAKLLMLPSPQPASVWPVFLLNKSPGPLFCSLLFPPLFLLTLTTGGRVLVCSCCFFDTFTPAPRHVANEWGLEVKQVWLASWNRRGWRSS